MTRIVPTIESQAERIAYLERAERDGWRRVSNWSWVYGGVIGWLVGVTMCLALSVRWSR